MAQDCRSIKQKGTDKMVNYEIWEEEEDRNRLLEILQHRKTMLEIIKGSASLSELYYLSNGEAIFSEGIPAGRKPTGVVALRLNQSNRKSLFVLFDDIRIGNATDEDSRLQFYDGRLLEGIGYVLVGKLAEKDKSGYEAYYQRVLQTGASKPVRLEATRTEWLVISSYAYLLNMVEQGIWENEGRAAFALKRVENALKLWEENPYLKLVKKDKFSLYDKRTGELYTF